jgi:hypothetical protein
MAGSVPAASHEVLQYRLDVRPLELPAVPVRNRMCREVER